MSTITTKDGTDIYYKDWGEGPVVTFSHGWPLSADAWDGQMLFLAQHGFRFGELAAEHGGDDLELVADVDRAGLGEDGADRRRDHLGMAFGHLRENVAQEMKS